MTPLTAKDRAALRMMVMTIAGFMLALRMIVAPMLMPVTEAGRITLCTGGQIVQVTWDGGTPGEADVTSESCPVIGVVAALAIGTTMPSRVETRLRTVVLAPAPHAQPTVTPTRTNRPRAPPLSV